MARPKAKQLTERELEMMHVFWQPIDRKGTKSTSQNRPVARGFPAAGTLPQGSEIGAKSQAEELTAAEVRQRLEEEGRDLAYTTVATLLRILVEKGFLRQTTQQRPFLYRANRSFKEVSTRLVSDLVDQVFSGSRETLLLRLVESKKLTKKERLLLEEILQEKKQ